MAPNQYSELFSVNMYHDYYASGICENVQFLPSRSIQKLISKGSLHLRKTPQGFSFYIATDQTVKNFLTYLTTIYNMTSFSFDVTSSDPNFRSFTDYPISDAGIFSFYTPTEGDVTTLERKFISDSTNTKSFTITIDFDAIIRFRESGNKPNYTVQFESRKTQWNYYIINTSDQTFGKLEIKGDSDILFEGPTEMTLRNGQKALLFSSGSFLVPLKERSEYFFDLVSVGENSNTATHIIYKGLPMANPTASEMNTEGDTKRVVTPIYIYI